MSNSDDNHDGSGNACGVNDALWQFPHTMTLKVFGEAYTPPGEPPLADVVCAIIARRIGDFSPRELGSRASAGGKYVAISVEVCVQDREQLDGLYRDLRAEPRVRTAI